MSRLTVVIACEGGPKRWPMDVLVVVEVQDDLVPGLDTSRIARVFRKGTDPHLDSYSGFFDNGHRQATGLGEHIESLGAKRVYLLGLTTDYCVKYTALDACALGFETVVIEDGCRGVDLHAGDSARALGEMGAAGVSIVHSTDVLTV